MLEEVVRSFGVVDYGEDIVSPRPLGNRLSLGPSSTGPIVLSPRIPTRSQGRTNSCTWQGITRAARFARIARGYGDEGDYSALAGYTIANVIGGAPRTETGEGEFELWFDNGARIVDAFESAAKFGLVLESVWPFDESKAKTIPPQSVLVEAHSRRLRVDAWEQIGVGDLRPAARAKMGIVIAMHATDDFAYRCPRVLERVTGKFLGDHMMAIRSVDELDRPGAWIHNSWSNWADEGETYATDEVLASESVIGIFAFDVSEWTE